MKPRFIDLSHTIKNGEVTYKGLPAPLICDFLSREDSSKQYDDNTSFQIGKIEMVSNTGTYIDCPFHRYEKGKDLSQVSINKMADIDGILIHVPYTTSLAIDKDYFEGLNLKNKAVLVYTSWSDFWQSDEYFENHPYLTANAATYLKEQEVSLVGIDSHNIDNTSNKSRPVHTILLKEEILIVEHMTNLKALLGHDFLFTAVPPKVEGFGTFPVRAFAKIL